MLRWLLHPLNTANRKIESWVLRRVKRQPGPVAVSRRRLYILPTRQGIVFAVMLLAMLLGAMNYSNSMAFALTFLLGGLGLVCMHHTHGNLVNLEVAAGRAQPVFAGETALFDVHLHNPSKRPRFALAGSFERGVALPGYADAPALDTGRLQLPVKAQRRGWVRAPRFAVSTEFPLGLFHAWTWLELDMQTIAYPKPEGTHLPPPPADGDGSTASTARAGDEEFAGVREYAHGDPPSAVHWKAAARTGELVVKQFSAAQRDDLTFDFAALSGLALEARLSQLCLWVLDAHASGANYGLRLPGQTLPTQSGEAHRDACLQALALYRPRSDSAHG